MVESSLKRGKEQGSVQKQVGVVLVSKADLGKGGSTQGEKHMMQDKRNSRAGTARCCNHSTVTGDHV